MASSCKVALVTGAGKGIGRAIALEMARKGYVVAVNYRSSAVGAREVVDQIGKEGGKAEAFCADVSDPNEAKRLFKDIALRLGEVSILINNAGITKDNLLLRMKDDEWAEVLSVNLNSVYYCTKEALRYMIRARWGRIVNVSSVAALMGNPGQANYAAAKAGIIGFTKSVAREVASRGITVNAVAPGFISTDMTAALDDPIKEGLLSLVPLGRPGAPEEVAKAVAFLASDDSGYITGQILAVDGGMTMH
ncbi:3-oxoacyl-[acyl-carrier-protein] reductase [Acetomicrobium sp. S15 = DSM 107314]|uniref:3-oxoacyl-[acyl-carrier-protein] reductase n=1 Tax=Acetomicrobium sp. S15 = DSM 107314 TaxID=2529858 RepID=UPI0018E13D7C|nr:3-oxoacyl-[acyl-carrier-protein] reductase [Acetomicrobium sp. S15 = DSM 107314]